MATFPSSAEAGRYKASCITQTLRCSASGMWRGGAHFSSNMLKHKEAYLRGWPEMNPGKAKIKSMERSYWNSIICLRTRRINPITTMLAKFPAESLTVYAWLREGCIPQQGIPTSNKYRNLLGLWSLTFHIGSETLAVFLFFTQAGERTALFIEVQSQDQLFKEDTLVDDSAPTLSLLDWDHHPRFLSKLCHLVCTKNIVSCLLLFWKGTVMWNRHRLRFNS